MDNPFDGIRIIEKLYYYYHYIPYTYCTIAGDIFALLITDNAGISPYENGEYHYEWTFDCSQSSICREKGLDCWLAGKKGDPFDLDEMFEYLKRDGIALVSEIEHLNIPAVMLGYLKDNYCDKEKILAALANETGQDFKTVEEWEEFLKKW